MPAARNAPATASMENFMVVVDVTMKSKRGIWGRQQHVRPAQQNENRVTLQWYVSNVRKVPASLLLNNRPFKQDQDGDTINTYN